MNAEDKANRNREEDYILRRSGFCLNTLALSALAAASASQCRFSVYS
jgi:hypothetical protein